VIFTSFELLCYKTRLLWSWTVGLDLVSSVILVMILCYCFVMVMVLAIVNYILYILGF